jgi:hypothetical protein
MDTTSFRHSLSSRSLSHDKDTAVFVRPSYDSRMPSGYVAAIRRAGDMEGVRNGQRRRGTRRRKPPRIKPYYYRPGYSSGVPPATGFQGPPINRDPGLSFVATLPSLSLVRSSDLYSRRERKLPRREHLSRRRISVIKRVSISWAAR